MKASDANLLTTASPIFYKNLTNLKNMAATVSAITKGQTITINVTTPGTSLIWPLSGDGSVEIPISSLN